MKIALAQLKTSPGQIATNVAKMVDYIRDAASRECDLIVLPEMSDTAYHMSTIMKTASSWNEEPFSKLAQAAREFRINVIAGLSEKEKDDIYNSVAVLNRDGELIAKYRKTHLITAEPVCEQNFIRPGDKRCLFEIEGFNIGVTVCYDIRFPEMARRLAIEGAEVIIVPSAFPMIRLEHWKTINACRAIENQVYVATANRVGVDEGLMFCGASQLIDPYGTIVTSASEIDETILTGEISKARIAEVRGRMRVWQDRREELYR